jgi:hypothetical protein
MTQKASSKKQDALHPDDLTWWECKQGHAFAGTFRTVRAGQQCPTCNPATDKLNIQDAAARQMATSEQAKKALRW